MNGQQPGPWRGAIAALCALLVGIGLARFAYTPAAGPGGWKLGFRLPSCLSGRSEFSWLSGRRRPGTSPSPEPVAG